MAPFPPGKGGGEGVEYGFKGKGVTLHALVDGNGTPLEVISTSAKGEERQQVLPLLKKLRIFGKRRRPRSCMNELQMDKGYDSQELRNQLRRKGIKPRIPKRQWHRKPRLGRKPAPLIDRWKVERSFAWIQHKFRRLCVRWERRVKYWVGFIELAISWMWLGKLT